MYTEELAESASIPDLDKTIVTDDNDQSDNSETGRQHDSHQTQVGYAEYTRNLLGHEGVNTTHASLHEQSYDNIIRNDHQDHSTVHHSSEIEHTIPNQRDQEAHYHSHHIAVSQETTLEEHKEDESPLLDPHDLPHNLDDPPIDGSSLRLADEQSRCIICGQDTGKPLLRFHPVHHDLVVSAAAPGVNTFGVDICLHIFCGRTASILPHVNRPDLEILPKAGIKNKHGIGQEVNAALSRTRCAVVTEPGAKEKSFYLVREFEANLAAVRQNCITYSQSIDIGVSLLGNYLPSDSHGPLMPPSPVEQQVEAFMDLQREDILEASESPPRKKRAKGVTLKQPCLCGGSYSNHASWKNHVKTKRHQKWIEESRKNF